MYDRDMRYYSPLVFIIKSVQQNQYFQSDRKVARWKWPDDCRLNALQTQYRACIGTWLPQVNAGSKFSIKATNLQDYELQVSLMYKLITINPERFWRVVFPPPPPSTSSTRYFGPYNCACLFYLYTMCPALNQEISKLS